MTADYIFLNSRDELLRIEVSKIIYLEGDGNYTYIVEKNGNREILPYTLAKMQTLLSNSLKEKAATFVRVGKKHIVNHHYVYRINIPQQRLELSDGESFTYKLESSKEALKALRELFIKSAIK